MSHASAGARSLDNRLTRERQFYDDLVVGGSTTRRLLDRFSEAFYDKGPRGRLWGSFWRTTDLKGAVVLDYGCGKGGFSQVLASLGACVYGIDISPQLIQKARAASLSGMNGSTGACQFLVSDAHHTPFGDNSFDYVFGNGALHHLDFDKALAEIARVLKPGGVARFMEPMYHHPLLWSLRRLTTSAHTIDEKPLSLTDLAKPKRWFRICRHQEHFLLSVCAAPVHLLGQNLALSVIDKLDRLDQFMMRVEPRLCRFAWYTVLEMEK
ncbi:MAG TPA: methyltransferase domain-containing protein [Terriglobales bacterium]|nr:methyltransferase domain-containing protein [Terriglobales bacterium]